VASPLLIVIDVPATIARLGPIALGWHGVLTVVAVLVALRVATGRAERAGATAGQVATITTWAVVGGLIGARLFFVIDHAATFLADPLRAFAIWQGGIAVYGAFIGGITAGAVAARAHGVRVWPLLDAAAPALLVGQAIGRIGCLLNADAWGAPTGSDDWGVVYRSPDALLPAQLLDVPTHPYPLYEITAVVLLLGLLSRLPSHARSGRLFLAAALGYAAIRFTLTAFRQEAIVLAGMQQAQVAAALTAAVAVALLLWTSRRPHGRTARPVAD
jgi:phosphatidylglycerol---prolipoprotein diacylglyceryl transferase